MAIDLEQVGQAFNVDTERYFSDALRRLEAAERDGLMHCQGLKLSATPLGKLLIHQVVMAFERHFPSSQR